MRVVDGDTVVVSRGGRTRVVRLLGIDTPETHRPRTPVECGGPDATANLRRLAGPERRGVDVHVLTDPRSGDVSDRYGRLLAYLETPGGDLGQAQLHAGWATVYRFHGRRFSRLGAYQRADEQARAARRGVWQACRGDFHASDGP